ncbi:GDSL-type esterase/lipase family protein [Mucilaginibacter sp. UR6-1]|uniref:SGNH/GDSL hydrolase family protein n=1 Tax=Mucilaginibacter sp. UR6-1 TaxID=1435643 RepID=UPI001E2885A2|nr:SGNH/GDSL hydrolase family protein [Mucilaginibacter sp. UR6-1]MCC8407960.1 GDSL-type esterase/lipase family protein [Mucilaginibacter sp. UR6-1]
MNKLLLYLVSSIFVLSATACSAQEVVIKNNDKHILYTGRVAVTDSNTMLSWTATTVKVNFKGTGVKVLLNDEAGDNYYNVIIDGKVTSVLHPEKGRKEYTLAADLTNGKHDMELFKRTEWSMGRTWIYQFAFDKGTTLLAAPAPKKRKIEVFGNSITCGYAVEDTTGQDRGTSPYENGYISYAAITARHFNADYYSTSKSGIGITISWFPLVMPEMYDRLYANDPQVKWDFSKYTPDVVVINLFQNDSWLTLKPEQPEFKSRFGTTAPTAQQITSAYLGFLKSIRAKYPKADIICALGNMDATKEGSPWPGYIKQAAATLNDKKVYTCFFPYKETPGHPNVAEQQAMARQLISFIDKNIKW